MLTFPLPVGMANRIPWIYPNLLWGGKWEERKFHLVGRRFVNRFLVEVLWRFGGMKLEAFQQSSIWEVALKLSYRRIKIMFG